MGSMPHHLHGSVQFADDSLVLVGHPKVDPVFRCGFINAKSLNKPADTKLYCFRLSVGKVSPATELVLTFIFSLQQSLLHDLKC